MDMVDMPKKETCDMNVMELVEKIMEVTKIAALNLWAMNGECTNIAIDECAQNLKDIRLQVDRKKLKDAIDNIRVAFRAVEVLTEIGNTKATNKSTRDMLEHKRDA